MAHIQRSKPHIILMAGGTGGHIFPAIALAGLLKSKGYRVSWLGTKQSMEARIVPAANIEIDYIPIQNLRGKGMLRWLCFPLGLLKATLIARHYLKQRQAVLVVGMGGFVSGPGALAAKLLNIPLLIHEQNSVAGMTNRYLAKIAKKIVCGFPKAFPTTVPAEYIGNPLRTEFIKLHELAIASPHQPLRLLVIGGSLGAKIFNETIPEALAQLPEGSIDLWQQTGEKGYEAAKIHFDRLGLNAKITPFIEDMATAYAWADLIICRAGALTISELTAAKKASILIPLPHAVDDHQRLNAEFLASQGAALLIAQKYFTPQSLAATLSDLLEHKEKLKQMAEIAGSLAKLDATTALYKHCLELLPAQ